MNSRSRNKKQKQKYRQVKQKELDKKNQRNHYLTSDRTFLKGIMPTLDSEYLDEQTKVAIYPTKPTKKEREFYNKYGVPVRDTWSADYVIIPYLMEIANATIEAGSIVDWTYHKVDIPIVNDKGEVVTKKGATIPEAVEIMTEYMSEYMITLDSVRMDYDYNLVKKKLETAFSIMGIIVPALWW